MSIIAIASLLATQAPITLVYQPKIGSTNKSSMTMTQTSQMGNTTTSMTTAMKVLGFENGYYKLQSTVSDVKVSGGMGNAEQMKKAMEKQTIIFIDKHFKPKFDAKGKDPMSQMMSGMNSSLSGVTFPSKPVKVGESWTNTIDMGALIGSAAKSQPGAAGMKSTGKLNMTYKLLKADASSVTIGMTLNGTVNMDMSGAKTSGTTQAMKMSMTMTGTGSYSMEKNTGTPIGSTMNMSMQMGGMGQAFNMKQTMVTKRI